MCNVNEQHESTGPPPLPHSIFSPLRVWSSTWTSRVSVRLNGNNPPLSPEVVPQQSGCSYSRVAAVGHRRVCKRCRSGSASPPSHTSTDHFPGFILSREAAGARRLCQFELQWGRMTDGGRGRFLLLGLIWTQLLISGKRLLSVGRIQGDTSAPVEPKSTDSAIPANSTILFAIHLVKTTPNAIKALKMWLF